MEITEAQSLAKARFWDKVGNNPMIQANKLPALKAAELAGTQQVAEWLRKPEFADWFFNRNATKQQLEAAATDAVKCLHSIVNCPIEHLGGKGGVTAAAQVNAAKVLLEYAGYAPPKIKEVIYKDKEVGEMDEAELVQLLKTEAPQLLEAASDE